MWNNNINAGRSYSQCVYLIQLDLGKRDNMWRQQITFKMRYFCSIWICFMNCRSNITISSISIYLAFRGLSVIQRDVVVFSFVDIPSQLQHFLWCCSYCGYEIVTNSYWFFFIRVYCFLDWNISVSVMTIRHIAICTLLYIDVWFTFPLHCILYAIRLLGLARYF